LKTKGGEVKLIIEMICKFEVNLGNLWDGRKDFGCLRCLKELVLSDFDTFFRLIRFKIRYFVKFQLF
jgi:hypothetical protein